jgi:hypothetical protein
MKTTLSFAYLICIVLVACSSGGQKRELSTLVDRQLVLPQSADRYENKDKQVFLLPTPIDSPMPIYPVALADRLNQDVVVCAEITISEDGEVSSVHEIQMDAECSSPASDASQALFPLVTEAVRRWTYFAGGSCTYQSNEAECDGADAKIDPLAVKLSYKFKFRRDGVGLEQMRVPPTR